MSGYMESNWFTVRDIDAFQRWLETECYFGGDLQIREHGGRVYLRSYGDDATALPERILEDESELEDEIYEPEYWDSQEFAATLRPHLAEPQEIVLLATGDFMSAPFGSLLVVPVA